MVKVLVTLLALTTGLFANVNHSLEIDKIIANDLKNKKLAMPVKVEDDVFVRRAYLDIVGRIPTFEEQEAFAKDPNKEKLIEKLINSQGYVEHTFNFWADLLRIKPELTGRLTSEAYATWLKSKIKDNVPYDQIVKSMLTAKGNYYDNPATGYFLRDEGMLLDNVSNTFQAFAGMDISCAQCHDHPFDDWTQMDYYELTAFFSAVNTRQGEKLAKELRDEAKMISDNGVKEDRRISNNVRNFIQAGGYSRNVDTNPNQRLKLPHDYQYKDGEPGDVIKAKTMVGESVRESGNAKKRHQLTDDFADWLISDKHPTFATNIVNRLWYRAMGFTLVGNHNDIAAFDEVYDSKNDRLLEYLVKLMKDLDYDTKAFNEILFNTNFYASETDGENEFRGPKQRRLTAAQLWDSLVQLTTGDVDKWQPEDRTYMFRKMYPSLDTLTVREIDALYKSYSDVNKDFYKGAPTNNGFKMIRSSYIFNGAENTFLLEFGRSDRELIAIGNENANITQLLTLINGKFTKELTSTNSYLAKGLEDKSRDAAIDFVFKSYIGRASTEAERKALEGATFEDIVWVLLNSHEFKLII